MDAGLGLRTTSARDGEPSRAPAVGESLMASITARLHHCIGLFCSREQLLYCTYR